MESIKGNNTANPDDFSGMELKLNKYFPFAFIYFFVNTVALPFGLTYTALFAPLFYIWIIWVRKREVLIPFLALMLPFILVHILMVRVDISVYAISFLNIILVYIFSQAAYTFFKVCRDPEKIFRWLLVINFVFCGIAILLYFTPYYDILWIKQDYTRGVTGLRRMKLLTYEASYYATLFTPLFFFFFLQYLFKQNKIPGLWLFPMIFLPLLLSLSIGVIGGIGAALFITWLTYFRRLTRKRRVLNTIIYLVLSFTIVAAVFLVFFRHNALFTRLGNIYSGEDLSSQGRTGDAFKIAGKILEEKNKYRGIGVGQVKLIGHEIIQGYYLYPAWRPVSIPNATAETWAVFGWIGLFIRFAIEIFFFFYTRVWSNYFRMLLFIFMFLYQFAGSFITNIAEYMIWILAFTNVFCQFDVRKAGEKSASLASTID